MSSARGLLIRLTARRVFYSGLPKETVATACSSTKSDAITPAPSDQVPQRASRKDDVGPVKRAAYAHIMRTGRFPSFDELKAELRATATAGGDGSQRSAAALLQAASSPPTPKLGHSGASASLPPPPAFATLPFNDDPPPRPAATHEPPPKPTAATMPAAQPAGQSSDAVAMEAPVSHGAAEDAPSPPTLPLVMDAQSSLQLLPLGGAATTAVSTLAAAQPGASAVSTVAAAQPSSDAMSTVDAAAEPAQKLVLRSPEGPPPPPSGPRRTEHGEWGERGGDGHDADSDAKLLTGCLYMLLFGVSMTALLLFVYEIFYRMFRDGLRSTPVLDSVDAQQLDTALRRRFDELRAEMEADFARLAVQQQQLVGVAMAQWAAAHDEELRRASEELVAELAARRGG